MHAESPTPEDLRPIFQGLLNLALTRGRVAPSSSGLGPSTTAAINVVAYEHPDAEAELIPTPTTRLSESTAAPELGRSKAVGAGREPVGYFQLDNLCTTALVTLLATPCKLTTSRRGDARDRVPHTSVRQTTAAWENTASIRCAICGAVPWPPPSVLEAKLVRVSGDPVVDGISVLPDTTRDGSALLGC